LHYITCPNFKSISKSLSQNKWSIINYPEHLNYFTPKSIHRFLLKQGFRKKLLFTSGISLKRLQASKKHKTISKNHLNQDEVFRQKMQKKIIYRIVFKTANFLLRISNKGDKIKAYYVKVNS
jgi:hypothetical protein